MLQHRGFSTDGPPPTGANDWVPSDSEVLDTLSDGIIVTDASGTIRRLNTCAARLLECRPSQLIGHNILQCMPTDDLDEFAEQLQAPDVPASYELSLRRQDGQEVVVHVGQRPAVSPNRDDAGTRCILFTLTDLSDFQQTHSMLQGRLRELSWFQKVSLDREERILELKRENDQLRTRLGLPTTQPTRDRLEHELDRRLKEL